MKIWQCILTCGVFAAMYTSAQSAIYMGTDADTPDTYQAQASYPQGLKQPSTPQANCELFYDGKGPLPPITCRTNTTTTTTKVTGTPSTKTTTPNTQNKTSTAANANANANAKGTNVATASASMTGANTAKKPAVAAQPAPKPKPVAPPMMVYTIKPGSLRKNVENIVNQSHWGKVVWNLPFDYNWVGTMTISAPDVQGLLAQLLKPYPVEAVFYDQNHIVSVVARRDK